MGKWRKWLVGLWYTQLRQTDMAILWPSCKKAAPSLDVARAMFAFHACFDPAWRNVFSEEEIYEQIDAFI